MIWKIKPLPSIVDPKPRLPNEWEGVKLVVEQAVTGIEDVTPFNEVTAHDTLQTMLWELIVTNPGRVFRVGPLDARIVEHPAGCRMVWSLAVRPGWEAGS